MLKLHIGGNSAHPDWKILDIEQRPEVDYIGNAKDLSLFEDNTVDVIYASHVLEHFYYKIEEEVITTLREWRRVLKVGGKLLISVPDLMVICWLYLHPHLTAIERHQLLGMIFGGQDNIYDVHKVGFDQEILAIYLEAAGFYQYETVSEFNLFEDYSSLRVLDTLISLNMIATKT